MLRAVVEHNHKKAYIDFNSSWDKIHRSLRHIGIKKNIDQLKINEPHIKVHFTKDSGHFYSCLRQLVNENDTYFAVYDACHILQSENMEFFNYLQSRLNKNEINSVADINITKDLYLLYKINKTDNAIWSFSADVLHYEQIHFLNKTVLFTPSRIDRTSVPKGVHCYEVQHDDAHRGIITMIGHHITVNFWGTILSSQKIGLDRNGYRGIDEKRDIKFLDKSVLTLKEYLNICPIKKSGKER